MDKHPNQLLNEMVAYYAIHYLDKLGYLETGSPINQASWDFLVRSCISEYTLPKDLDGIDLGPMAANIQRQLIDSNLPDTSLRTFIGKNPGFKHLKPLMAHGPQALLIESYLPMLQNIYGLDMGFLKYGMDKNVYRNITINVKAARRMFETASQKIAYRLYKYYENIPELVTLVEGGAGNGAATLNVLEAYTGKKPGYLLTDIDPKTQIPAKELFKSKGYKLPWMKVDLGSVADLQKVQELAKTPLVIFMVNFIIHEHESILENFFQAMSEGLPQARLVISEFFLPENLDEVGPTFPHWFVYLHEVSGQRLRTEKDFMAVAEKYGYRIYDRVDHQLIDKKPLVSTLFLAK